MKSSGHVQELPNLIGILSIVLVYVGFVLLWTLLSDETIEWLIGISADDKAVSITKGWVFLVLPLLLITELLRRLARKFETPVDSKAGLRQSWWPLIMFHQVILALTVLSIVYSVSLQKEQVAAELLTITDLKSHQVADWIDEMSHHAEIIRNTPFGAELYHRWRQQGDEASRLALLRQLEEFSRQFGFHDTLLLDSPTSLALSASHTQSQICSTLCKAVERALEEDRVVHCGPYLNEAGEVFLDFVAPLPDLGTGNHPIIVLRLDPAENLYPLLNARPVPRASTETLLFRQEGDQVSYLNGLRNESDTAVNLRFPVATVDLLAARALRAESQLGRVIDGVDYRGVPSMGIALPVPGTDWLLMSKVNLAEVYGGMSGNALWIALVGILTMAAATISAILVRQRQALNYALSTQDAQAEKLRALQLLDAIANSSPEIIFAKDLAGNYTLFNRAACRFSGKSEAEVLGRDQFTYMPPEQAEPLRALHRRIITRDETYTEEMRFSTAHGEKVMLGTVGPLHDADGAVIGSYGIVRDITELKQQEQELVRSKNKLRELSAHREKVREDERAYIARELHDDLGQYLTALRMDANLVQMVYAKDNEELATRLSGMKELIDHLIAETRSVITRLRPMTLDLGLVSAAEWLIADYQERTGTACHLEVPDPELQLDNDHATTLFRILQESLTNVARHARAKRVDIRIDIVDGVLQMEVRDDGRGFDPSVVRNKKTFGLMGIRERVVIHGGSAKIDTELGKGTVLRVTLPLVIGEVA